LQLHRWHDIGEPEKQKTVTENAPKVGKDDQNDQICAGQIHIYTESQLRRAYQSLNVGERPDWPNIQHNQHT
jgi:hypothetical protein